MHGCADEKNTTQSDATPTPTDPETPSIPITGFIKNLGITFAPYDAARNRAGDFLFRAKERKVFLEFGDGPAGSSATSDGLE